MSEHSANRKATKSIRSLTAIGLMAGCLLLGVEEYLGRYMANRHQELAEDQSNTTRALETLSEAVEASDVLLQDLLKGTGQALANDGGESVTSLIASAESALADLQQTGMGQGFISQQYLDIEPKVRAWRRAEAQARARFDVRLDDVRRWLKDSHAQVQSVAGRQRLMQAVALSEYRRLEGEAAQEVAGKILTELGLGADFGGIQLELSELSLLVQMLITESDQDLLVDLKDNRLSPSLARLRQLYAKADAAQENNEDGVRALEGLELALFGEGYVHEKAHQAIILGLGGLFNDTLALLSLREQRARLQARLGVLRGDYAEGRVRIAGMSRDRGAEALTEILGAAVSIRLRTLPAALLAALAFVLLARGVARALLDQVRDLSASNRKAVKALLDLELTQRSIPSILIGMDSDRRINTWNVHASTILQTSESVAIDRTIERIPVEWDATRLTEALEDCARSREVITLNGLDFITEDGRHGSLELRICPKLDDDGQIHGMLIVGKDVQDRLDMECQLAQARKLESIGQLAAGIAHEINTPTQYATDNVHFLGDASTDLLEVVEHLTKMLGESTEGISWPADEVKGLLDKLEKADLEFLIEEVPKSIEQCLQGLGTVADIVRAMKEFSHPGVTEKTLVELNRSIESTVAVARNEWRYVADVELALEPGLPLVPCVQGEMNQVFLNLLVNAAHAIVDGREESDTSKGKITISTMTGDGWVEIRIADSGCGIPDEVRERIFDPFFTTKDIGRGTGQGLAIARSVVVDKHQGSLRVESDPDQGTTFIIRLPLEHAESAE